MSRIRLVQDDSCHWYAIPADQEKQFEKWIAYYQNEEDSVEEPYVGPDFDKYQLGLHISCYSFAGLKEDREAEEG